MSIMLGNPGGSPAASEGPLLALGSPKARPAAPRKGNGLGKPNKEWTGLVATEVETGGGGAIEVLKGWNGDSGVELERPFLVGVK